VSTASRNCWFHLRRLQAVRNNARAVSESFGGGPWTLRSKRLQWLKRFDFSMKSQNRYNITDGFKIAALSHRGFEPFFLKSICPRLEAMGGHSPPTFIAVFAPP
jgi:hypothetical protein